MTKSPPTTRTTSGLSPSPAERGSTRLPNEANAVVLTLDWGLDDSVWDLYGVSCQPVTFLITGSDVVVDTWAGPLDADEIRSRLDSLVALGA